MPHLPNTIVPNTPSYEYSAPVPDDKHVPPWTLSLEANGPSPSVGYPVLNPNPRIFESWRARRGMLPETFLGDVHDTFT